MLSQPRTARKTASNSWRRSESGTARMRMTMGLRLRRTARRINRLNGARMLILSGYAAQPHSQTPDFLALSITPELLHKLEHYPMLAGIKDSTGTAESYTALCKEFPKLSMMTGTENNLPIALEHGMGAILV